MDHGVRRMVRGTRHVLALGVPIVLFGVLFWWRLGQLSLAAFVFDDCQGTIGWGINGGAWQPKDLLGVPGMRLFFGDTPSSLRFIPRDGSDVAILLGHWDSIRSLGMRADNLTDPDLRPVSSLPGLETLQVDVGTHICGAFLADFVAKQSLEVLYLKNSGFIDDSAPYVGQMAKLRYLNLSHTQLSDAGMAAFGDLGLLQKLYVSYTRVSGASMAVISSMHCLEELALAHTRIDGSDLAQLCGNAALYFLSIEGLSVTADDIQFLTELPELERVWCSLEAPELERALPIFTAIPRLQQLMLFLEGPIPDELRADYAAALRCQVDWPTRPLPLATGHGIHSEAAGSKPPLPPPE